TATWDGDETSMTVNISATYKNDSTIIGEKTFTVYKDNDTTPINLQYGMDVREGGVTTGTEVSTGKGTVIPVSFNPNVLMHKNYTRLICLGSDSPSSSIQNFIWSKDRQTGETGNITVSQYGTITAKTEGTITIKGIYKYNSKYVVTIVIDVEN
ncbi:MAG: hypothetical protein WCS56_03670, partial [Bacilli bacterium]